MKTILRMVTPAKCWNGQAEKLGEDLRREVSRNVVAAANAQQHMDRVASNMTAIFDGMKDAIDPDGAKR